LAQGGRPQPSSAEPETNKRAVVSCAGAAAANRLRGVRLAMAAPTLPIKNRSTVTPAGGSGRTPKKSGGAKPKDGSSRHKAWADFTPTPWLDYAPTPWSNTAGMPPYNSVFMGAKMSKADSKREPGVAEMSSAWPSTPTPKSWGATPTPSGGPAVPTNFGITGPPPPPMMAAGMPFMPPGFAAMAQMAEAAAAAAGAAAAAAAAAGTASADASPDDTYGQHDDTEGSGKNKAYASDAYDSPPWMQPGMPLPPGPPPMNTLPPQNLPSKGSASHGTGKCRPCAWFWKPHGCHSADDCNYCHLCPEGELKTRKKLKVAAMRMGALTPAKPGNTAGTARTLKLTSLV